MKIQLHNQQTKHRLDQTHLHDLARWLGDKIESEGARWGEVTLLLCDDATIIPFNRTYFKKDYPTDVISFRQEPVPGEADELTGDLIINVERAYIEGGQQAGEDFELAFYIAHGFDHLNGATDETPEKRQAMHQREKKWLKEATETGVFKPLFT
jgi:rRNA maturation RNase YbeY